MNKTLHTLALFTFLVANVSAYHFHGRTAIGIPAGPKVCAVDTRVIPLRSRVRVNGRWYYAADRTRHGEVDIWMSSTKKCRLFGRHRMKVEIRKPPKIKKS